MPIYQDKYCKAHGVTRQRLVNYKTGQRFRCQKCDNEHQRKASEKIKRKCVEYKGGKCSKCGYNKCLSALEFHHLDPLKKEFGIRSKKIKWDILKQELDKCLLVCANCHREIHAKEYNETENK